MLLQPLQSQNLYLLGLKDLTWLLFAPNLTSLRIESLLQLEEIMNKEESASYTDVKLQDIIPFRKLERLELCALPMLKSIYWSALPFPCLREIYVVMCPNLRKLPLDCETLVAGEKLRILYKERMDGRDRVGGRSHKTSIFTILQTGIYLTLFLSLFLQVISFYVLLMELFLFCLILGL